MSQFNANDLAFFGIAPGVLFQGSSLTATGASTGSDQWKFLTKQQRHRLKFISEHRMLFEGFHREYYLDQSRTQFAFANLRVSGIYGDDDRQLYIVDNILERDSVKSADLLYGEEPILRIAAPEDVAGGDAYIAIQEKAQRAFVTDLVKRCNLAALFHEKAVDCAVDTEGFVECRIERGEVWVVSVPSWELFPVGNPGADQQYAAYDRFRMDNIGTDEKPIFVLLITHYLPGSIDRELWQLENGAKFKKLSLDQWETDAWESPLVEHQPTGVSTTTIVRFVNQIKNGCAASDYTRTVKNLQDAHNAKMSQLAWVIAQHTRPKLSRHSRHAAPDGSTRADYDVEFNDSPEEASKYITWDAQLAAATRDRDFTLGQLLMALESSPVLLGINLGENAAHATAFKSFRLMASNALAKAARKSLYQKAGVAMTIDLACRMVQTITAVGKRFDIYAVAVTLRDGIPLDALEDAQRLATLRGAGGISRKRMVNEQINDPDEAQAELEELEEEDADKTPSILMQPPQPDANEQPPEDPEAGDKVAAEDKDNAIAA